MTLKSILWIVSALIRQRKTNHTFIFFIFASFLILPNPSGAYAEDLIWHSVFDWYGARGASPSQACNSAVAKYNEANPNPASTVRVTSVTKNPNAAGQYLCFWCQGKGSCPDVAFTATRNTKVCEPPTIYDDTIDDCTNATQKGQPVVACPSSQGGNPIDFSSGNKFQVEHDFKDSNLKFTRTYNSLDGLWRHNYSTRLRISSPYVALVLEDGREVVFYKPSDTPFAPTGEFGVLAHNGGQWTYTSKDKEVLHFNSVGLLTRIDKPYGYTQLSRIGSRVDVVDNLGSQLSFTAREDGQPLSLQAEGWQFQYAYDANNNLIRVTRQKSGLELDREYHYEDSRNPRLLTGITDERGIRFATWSYDEQGRGISSEHAGGVEKINIAYNSDGTATVINEFGKSAVYKFAFVSSMKRIVEIKGEPSPNCLASNSKFYYNTSGLLSHIINNKGVGTFFQYDNRGLETQRTEAYNSSPSRTTYTEWHQTFPLPIKVTEPTRITTYTYDAQGRQLSQSVTQR